MRIAARAVKATLLPEGRKVRRLPLGIGRGLRVGLDLQQSLRLYVGLYECELNPHLRRLCRGAAFDVGGQYGYDAAILARLSGRQVVTFECDSDCWPILEQTIAANPQLDLKLERAAVGRAAPLDEFALRHGYPQFMKIDVDGMELEVLESAGEILARRPALIVETHSLELEQRCRELLLTCGYEVEIVEARRWLPDYRPIPHNRFLIGS
jgi:hypothetical protein